MKLRELQLGIDSQEKHVTLVLKDLEALSKMAASLAEELEEELRRVARSGTGPRRTL